MNTDEQDVKCESSSSSSYNPLYLSASYPVPVTLNHLNIAPLTPSTSSKMDLIEQGYGSDSSDGSAEKKSQTLGLLANYSDDSSTCSSEDDGDREDDAVMNPLGTCDTENNSSTNSGNQSLRKGNSSFTAETSPSIKKRKLSSETKSADTNCGLPPPQLLLPSSSADPSLDNLFIFSKNYLTNKLQYKISNTDSQLQIKLEQMHQHTNSGISFAEQLKCQQDFGNPHMFPSAIEHFGIDPLESNASDLKATFGEFEFIDRLMVKEEENRIREGQKG
jgi:hypothetical protein